ncbi:MAG: serine hydrolase [Bacteroidetes bacterium]|nr:serine hydrolase [Bacteroidota bacterium]
MKQLLFFIALLLTLPGFAQKKAADIDKKIAAFDAYVQASMRQWEVPGMSVAVVKDGKVIYMKGLGVRELGKPDAVNTDTKFSIGSTTKAMTAACMGMLVDEGKIKWDDLVMNYLPEFQLYDPFVTRELRIRDLFIHNSGVGNADFLWSMMDIPPAEILNKMRWVKPSYSMRSSFIYQNIFYVAAGEVIRKVSGKPWEVFIQERIFNPLGMTQTATKLKTIKDENYTKPHYRVEKVIQSIGYTKDDNIGPAGSVWSSINDMSKWTICMIDSSKYPGGRLLTARTWAEMFKPQTIVPAAEFYPTTMKVIKPNWTTYGLGWFQHDYKGRKINYHTGSLAGLTAIHAQLPDEKLGVYVLGNMDHAEVRHALVYKCFDLFALGGDRDWSSEFKTLYAQEDAKNEKAIADFESKHVPGTKTSLPLDAYAGTYTDPLYGQVRIIVKGNSLDVSINNDVLKLSLDHWEYDSFRGWFEKKWYGKANAVFTIGADGTVSSVNLLGIDLKRVKG